MTTPRNHTKLYRGALGLVLMLLTALPAAAQDLRGMQLFAQAEVTGYDQHPNGLPPKEGFFFVWDHLLWHMSKPDVVVIGNPIQQSRIVYNVGDDVNGWTQTNTHNTSELMGTKKSGDRIEFGRMFRRHGWLVSAYELKTQTSRVPLTNVGIVFADDPTWGVPAGGRLQGPVIAGNPRVNLPVIFDYLEMENRVHHWSVEMMGIARTRQMHHGGFLEFFGGVRYLVFDEEFNVSSKVNQTLDPAAVAVNTYGPATVNGYPLANPDTVIDDRIRNILADSMWNTDCRNHLVGPQVGIRWFRKRRRWMLSSEGRFFAAWNQQAIRQKGVLGSDLLQPVTSRLPGEPDRMKPTDFDHSVFQGRFCPAAEVRVDARYQFSRSVSARVGWTGMYLGQVGRASEMVDYSLRNNGVMGILASNWQTVYVNGFNIGIDVNR